MYDFLSDTAYVSLHIFLCSYCDRLLFYFLSVRFVHQSSVLCRHEVFLSFVETYCRVMLYCCILLHSSDLRLYPIFKPVSVG